MLFSPQIPLPLEPRREARFDDFVAGPNQTVVDALRHLFEVPATGVFLHGAESSGKTHLLHALCHHTRESGRTAFYASLRRRAPEQLMALAETGGLDAVCLDDLDAVAGEREWEESLFHLFNRLLGSGGRLVVSSAAALAALPLVLPDLRSRLASGLRLQLQSLGESEKLQVLERHAASVGLDLPDEVGRYLLSRGHRSLRHLIDCVDRLQHAAFTAKRRVTVPLAREVLHR